MEDKEYVCSPSHYNQGAIECIDAIEAAICRLNGMDAVYTANIIKYMWRWREKGSPKNDLKKAKWYLEKLIEDVEKEHLNPCK